MTNHRPPDAYLTSGLEDLVSVYGVDATCTELERLTHALVLHQTNRAQQPAADRAMPSHNARTTDPDTSQASGRRNQTRDVGRFSVKSRQAELLGMIAHYSSRDERGLTAYEAAVRVMHVLDAKAALSQIEGCRRRVSDLREAGYVKDSGVRRLNLGSPDESIVWVITDAGYAAIAALNNKGWSR